MPISDQEFYDTFEEYTGTTGPQRVYEDAPNEAAGWEEWSVLAAEAGVDDPDTFGAFLVAFYPQEGLSGPEWDQLRNEFFEAYDIDPNDLGSDWWEAYREAIGYE